MRPGEQSQRDWRRHLPAGAADPWPLVAEDDSLTRCWRERWREQPDAVALVDLTDGAETSYSRADLAARSAAAARLLHERGVRRGDRVLFSGGPSASYLFLYVGALRLGAVIVPANTGYTSPELAHIVADSGATLAVVDDSQRIADGLPVVVPASVELDAAVAEADAAGPPPLDEATARDLAMIAYTSGTTGRPKGAMLSHGNLLASARAVTIAWRWTADDGLVLALPLFHMHGLGVGIHGSLTSGGRILMVPGFKPELVATACARADATLFFGVPTMHKRLLEHAEAEAAARDALASLRLVVSGSAPLSGELWERVRAVTGQRILERYGMTETIMNISNPYDGERRPGTVGIPLPGVEIRLDGGGDGDSEAGEILVRGENVFGGYWQREDATAEAFTEDGWFRTGDVGQRSPDGYVSIVGRSKELIISGGYNVYPREVEEVLETHPGIHEAAVVGRPSEEWGEVVTAFFVHAADAAPPTADELAALASTRLAGYKQPRAYHVLDQLPRNAMGKVERGRLVELLGGEGARANG